MGEFMEPQAPMPMETPPAEPTAPDAAAGLPWSLDIAEQWRGRIKRAIAKRQLREKWDDAALESYAPKVSDDPKGYESGSASKRNFTLVERKLAELFYQRPEVSAEPSPLMDALGPAGQDITGAFNDIVNEKLGLDGVNVKDVFRQAIFDYELFGKGWTVMGYRSYSTDIQVPITDQMGQPVIDPVTQEPLTKTQPVVVKSECFWENPSPRQMLEPANWRSTNLDKAPWCGMEFSIALNEAKRMGWNLPEDFTGSEKGDGKTHFDHGDDPDDFDGQDIVTGKIIWYKSAIFLDDAVHPDAITELVLVDGIDEPVKHEPSNLQSFDEQGRLTPDSLIGFPVHPIMIRTMTDASQVMSDVAVSLQQVEQLDTFRKQSVAHRNANLIRWAVKAGIGKDTLDKIIHAPQNGVIVLPDDLFDDPNGVIRPLPQGHIPQENFALNDVFDNDLSRTHAIDSTAAGTTSGESGLTATEANLRQANVNIRLGWEQSIVADRFVQGVTKFATILQRFLSLEDAAQIVGMPRAQAWDAWRKSSPVRFSFTMTPDSSLRNDTPLDRKQLMDYYTFVANDPTTNRDYLNRKLARKNHLDPAKAVLQPNQVPKKQPEPVMPTVAIKDLAVLTSPLVLAFIGANPQWGIAIPEEVKLRLIQQAQQPQGQQPHGGKVAEAESLSKHQSDETGAQNGSGQFTPLMGGGVVQ